MIVFDRNHVWPIVPLFIALKALLCAHYICQHKPLSPLSFVNEINRRSYRIPILSLHICRNNRQQMGNMIFYWVHMTRHTHTHLHSDTLTTRNKNIKIITPINRLDFSGKWRDNVCVCVLNNERGEIKRHSWTISFPSRETYSTHIQYVKGYMSPQCRVQVQCCQLSCSCRRTPLECSSRMCHREGRRGTVYQYRPSPRPGWRTCWTGGIHKNYIWNIVLG